MPSLVAAAALLTDYILTVAVSVAAGVLALTSAVSSLRGHELALSLGFVLLIALANLRGVREAGAVFALPTYAFVTSIFVLLIVGGAKCADGTCPRAIAPHPLVPGPRRGDALRRPARVRLRIDRPDGRRGDRERRERVPPAARAQRRPHTRHSRRDRDHDVRRRLLARGAHARAADGDRYALGAVRDRARRLPRRLLALVHVLGGAGSDARRARAGRQHLLPGLPAPRGAPRARPVLRPPVREPRRQARLLERHHRAHGHLVPAALDLQRKRRLAHPPVRDRRLHGVHALPGGHGAVLAPHTSAAHGTDGC